LPKKILNLDETIFQAAWKLFSNDGYDNVDMKAIAKECNIAVGTLYNYYNNKMDLFLKVLEASWNSTFEKIEKVMNEDKNSAKALESIIKILYEDIKVRRGIGSNLLKSEAISKTENQNIENGIIEKIYSYVINAINIENQYINMQYRAQKLTHIILCNIVLLARLYPEDDKANIDFLIKIVHDNLK
jgi:AcrR family transcriptional regulator